MLICLLVWVATTMSDREWAVPDEPVPEIPQGVGDVLAVLRSSGVIVGRDGRVITTSPAAISHGFVRHGSLAHPEIG